MQELWQNPFLIWLIFKRRAATYAVSQSTSIVLLLFLFPALYAGWSADLSQLSSLGPWRPAALGLHHTTRARVRTRRQTLGTSKVGDLEVSAGYASPSSRGLRDGDELLLSTGAAGN
jgi:hypothetical protein